MTDFPLDDSEYCRIGVPGKLVEDADDSKIYMLKWDKENNIMAQACDPARTPAHVPEVTPGEDERSFTFLLEYHSKNDYVLFRDCSAGAERYLRTNGRGIITCEALSWGNEQHHYHSPGFLYFIQLEEQNDTS
ncbi:uncharacterized protein LOC144344279 [Saccoglossus kowalevskii]